VYYLILTPQNKPIERLMKKDVTIDVQYHPPAQNIEAKFKAIKNPNKGAYLKKH